MDAQSPAVQRLMDFLRIPSVSTDPAYAVHVRAAAQWVQTQLDGLGFTTELVASGGGHPAVLARSTDAIVEPDASTTVLFYGHHDVQPPDPLEGWTTPPFEPSIRDSRTPDDGPAIYARGACDDKGQVLTFIEALRNLLANGGRLPCRVTLLIEGEEECGSRTLPRILEERADDLRADVALVSDTAMWDAEQVAITYGLRGLVYFDIKLHGPDRDLHSGVYGGTLANPAERLTWVLGKLFDDDHRVTIPGFYEDVAPLDPAERAAWDQLDDDGARQLSGVGAEPFGEAGFSTHERNWARPACDVNGLYGGYGGEGAKTVIPAMAGAKVSFRIPGHMDPQKVADSFVAWLHGFDDRLGGCRWELENHGVANAVLVPRDSVWMRRAGQAITEATGKPPVLMREGATIPVIADLQAQLKLDTLLIGFGLHADNIHSPDEHFALRRFGLGIRVHEAVLRHLAG